MKSKVPFRGFKISPPHGAYATWSHIKGHPTDKFTTQRINFPPIRELVAFFANLEHAAQASLKHLGGCEEGNAKDEHLHVGLVRVGLAAVRELEPESWVSSFKRVNLNPHERVAFPVWCERIGGFLEGGQLFKTEDELDVYQLLPVFWQVHSMINMRYKMFLVILNNCCQHAHSKHATLVVCAVYSSAGHVAGGEEERCPRV